jgi:hypothetical protein
MITIKLENLSAMNLLGLAIRRLEELDELQEKHPDLPIKDAGTVASYESAIKTLRSALGEPVR